ncbi:hypothetical protein R3P38DRAFT_3029723, partial [Favolaschia claudopus]
MLPAQPAPPIDAALGRAIFQHNTGQFRRHVVTNARLFRHIAPTQLATFRASPHNQITLCFAEGGNALLNATHEIPPDIQLTDVLRTVCPNGVLEVSLPIPEPGAPSGKYNGPVAALVLASDNAGATAIKNQAIFSVHGKLAVFVHGVADNNAVRQWPIGHWKLVRPARDLDAAANALRVAVVKAAFHDPATFLLVDQLTQARGGEQRARVFDALKTIHVECLPHPDSPVFVVHMQPLTTNEDDQERFCRLLRPQDFYFGNHGFYTRARNGHPPECATCKMSSHPTFLCPYTDPDL